MCGYKAPAKNHPVLHGREDYQVARRLVLFEFGSMRRTSVKVERVLGSHVVRFIADHVIHLTFEHEDELFAGMIEQGKAITTSIDRDNGRLHVPTSSAWSQQFIGIVGRSAPPAHVLATALGTVGKRP